MSELVAHSFEAGNMGKPDELENQLVNLIGAYFLEEDENSRFDLRVLRRSFKFTPLHSHIRIANGQLHQLLSLLQERILYCHCKPAYYYAYYKE